MARETAQEKKIREAKVRKAGRRKERRDSAAQSPAEPQVQHRGEGVDPDPLRQLEHQIARLSQTLSQLSETADLVRPRKPRGVEQLHRRVVCTVFDKDGIRIGGSQHDLSFEDALTLTVSGSEMTAQVDTGGR
jgi:hypothetical protein